MKYFTQTEKKRSMKYYNSMPVYLSELTDMQCASFWRLLLYHLWAVRLSRTVLNNLVISKIYRNSVSDTKFDLYSIIYPTRCNIIQFIYIWKLLYMFWTVPPPIIRSAYNCIYSIWYLSHRYCYLPLWCSG
jgi:hypothetical protein